MIIDQSVHLVTNDLDDCLVEDSIVNESRNGDPADSLYI